MKKIISEKLHFSRNYFKRSLAFITEYMDFISVRQWVVLKLPSWGSARLAFEVSSDFIQILHHSTSKNTHKI